MMDILSGQQVEPLHFFRSIMKSHKFELEKVDFLNMKRDSSKTNHPMTFLTLENATQATLSSNFQRKKIFLFEKSRHL